MENLSIRESRARRALRKLDLYLKKTPARSWLRYYYGVGYQVIDYSNTVVAGCATREYQMTIDDVEEYAVYRASRNS